MSDDRDLLVSMFSVGDKVGVQVCSNYPDCPPECKKEHKKKEANK